MVSSRDPQTIVAARKGSPLLIGVGNGEYFLASDASAILAHTREVVYLDDGDLAVLTPDGERGRDINATPIRRSVERIEWDLAAIERICEGGPEGGPIGELPARQRFHWLTAPRSSIIQMSIKSVSQARPQPESISQRQQPAI